MKPYAELLEFNQPNPIRKEGFTRIRDAFPGLNEKKHRSDLPPTRMVTSVHSNPERIVEFAGRWDYGEKNAQKLGQMVTVKYEPTGGQETNSMVKQVPIIQKYIDMGHESMLEMADATFFIECSRVVSHELVRHRILSVQQESQRFVKYDDDIMSDLFYVPGELDGHEAWVEYGDDDSHTPDPESGMSAEDAAKEVYLFAAALYKELRREGVAPQIARYVLPNAMRTRLVMKTNLREWRHIIRLRLDKSAQPEMRELMQQVHDQLVDVFPNVMHGVLDGERGVR